MEEKQTVLVQKGPNSPALRAPSVMSHLERINNIDLLNPFSTESPTPQLHISNLSETPRYRPSILSSSILNLPGLTFRSVAFPSFVPNLPGPYPFDSYFLYILYWAFQNSALDSPSVLAFPGLHLSISHSPHRPPVNASVHPLVSYLLYLNSRK